MSPKTTSVKSKKESKDSKRHESPHEAGLDSSSRYDHPHVPPEGTTRKGSVYKPSATTEDRPKDTYFPSEFDMESVGDIKEEANFDDCIDGDADNDEEIIKFSDYFKPLAKMVIKVIVGEKTMLSFPMLMRKIVNKKTGKFIRLNEISKVIAKLIDDEIEGRQSRLDQGVHTKLFLSDAYDYGEGLDLRIESFSREVKQEFYLSSENYDERFVMAYDENQVVTLLVYVEDRFKLDPKYSTSPPSKRFDDPVKHEPEVDQLFQDGKSTPTFRGIPINLGPNTRSNHDNTKHFTSDSETNIRNSAFASPRKGFHERGQSSSPVSIYDEDDYRVQDVSRIVPFGQESVKNRVVELQSIAMTNIPEVSSIPKLLKSHNASYKKDENASTWYSRFHNFCAMIGIYLCPPKAMEKNSVMGREWESNALPRVLYSRHSKMIKILTHILSAPDFFPRELQDDLQLNPHPYNFLRLFMALHSHAVPDLSDRVIKRPGVMKASQTLAQYALSWVHYFQDEETVNGVQYSKFRQYCYFLDGLPNKYSLFRKFLDMEFTSAHDKVNQIPISLELRNLPATILSLAQLHGISLTTPNSTSSGILRLSDSTADNFSDDIDDIKLMESSKLKSPKPSSQRQKVRFATSPNTTGVQCWLCDGSHSFRQCKELERMKSVCIKRPSVLKHFQQLLIDKNGDAIRILIDAPEFFDESVITNSSPGSDDSTLNNEATGELSDQIGSMHMGSDVTDEDDIFVPYDVISCIHYDERSENMNHSVIENPSILSISDPHSINNSILQLRHVSLPRVQVDGGADRSITPHRELVHGLRPPNPSAGEKTHINDAGVHPHEIVGYGYFRVRCVDENSRHVVIDVPCAFIPTIPSTLLNFRTIPSLLHVDEASNMLLGVGAAYLLLLDPNDNPYRLVVPLIVHRTRLYADNALITQNGDSISVITDSPKTDAESIQIVSDEPSRLLWHSRLGHLHFRSLSDMHRYAKGIPKFKQSHVIDHCSTCLASKLRRSPRGHGTIAEKADTHGQVLCADWGFICQNSNDPSRVTRLSSVYGDTSYLIFVCAYTGAIYGVCAGSKSVPTKWLHILLHRLSAGIQDKRKHILVDRGSELGRSQEFKKIAELHGYLILTAGPDKSTMNGLGERPHSTIGDALRSMLHASGLDLKYWNFAFYHFLRIYNLIPHGNRPCSPFEMVKGYKPDLSLLRVFGCDVFIRPPGRRQSKLDLHCIRGRFLGYTSTLKQIYYVEYGTSKIKVAAHARFDEGMASTPIDQLPPYAVQLRRALGHSIPDTTCDDVISTPNDIDLLTSQQLFPVTFTHTFTVKQSDIHAEFDTLGFIVKNDLPYSRCYVADILPKSTAATYPRWHMKLIGCFILCIGDEIITDKNVADAALSRYVVDACQSSTPVTVSIVFASDKALLHNTDADMSPSPIQLDQICHVSSLIETGEEIKYQARLDMDWLEYFDNLVSCPNPRGSTSDETIHKVSTSQFTRKQLKASPDFDAWLQAEFKQLDKHEADNMFGDPCPRPKYAVVLRSIWSYAKKWNNELKARHCCDGRPLRDDRVRRMEAIYTACVSQVGMKLFMALVALLNYVILDLDAVNAFGQAGSLFEIIYLEIDQQYRDWYKARKGKEIPIGWVLPVKGSLQGHPDSGEIWQTRVNEVLEKYGFTTTTHEPCLYRGIFKDKQILLCRQVDDMLIAGEEISIVREFAHEISKHLKVTIGEKPSTHYNGLDILQTKEGIKISCETYIEKLRKAHGWDGISSKKLEPIDPNRVKELESSEGPPVDSNEGKLLRDKNGFNYRGVVGEIVYAYITCRPDYAFAVSLLSRFNTCPAQCHYDAAKRCLKSLIRTANEGIWYWRREPRCELEPSTHVPRKMEDFEKKFPILKDPFLVSGICDVSIAPGILMRRSFGGTLVFLGNLYLILYVAKLQPMIASSSGEGEFIQLVLTGKKIKYVRAVMADFGFPQTRASPIFGDNMSSIMMANNVRPTDRTRHMDIRWFALQEWIHVDKDIIVIHIAGIINPSDALTKALAWLKHCRHMSRAMGHLGSPFAPGIYRIQAVRSESISAVYVVPTEFDSI